MPDPMARFDVVILANVLGFTTAEHALTLARVSKAWHRATLEDSIWGQWCRADFHTLGRLAPNADGRLQVLTHYKAVWCAWRALGTRLGLQRVEAPVYERVAAFWELMEKWTQEHRPEIHASLAPGASRAEFEALENRVGQRLPDVMKMIWGIHNGQCLAYDEAVDRGVEPPDNISSQVFDGLLGGYSFYSHFVCNRLFPLQRIMRRAERALQIAPSCLIIAASWDLNKPVFLKLTDAMVYVTRTQMPCVPVGELGVLRWLEEYAGRLTTGVYRVEHLISDAEESLGISLFPQSGPEVSVCVTHGIEAKAMAIYVPENQQSSFTYSVRLQVVDPGALGFPRAQLLSRHWRIQDGRGSVEEVHGEGVIGKFPVLHVGGYRDDEQGQEGPEKTGTFVYQSCSGRLRDVPPAHGQFSGTLDFVPGTMEEPLRNEPLEVEVGAFPLRVPEFIF